ncbi:MAG: hypothetical protein ACRCU6_10860, partial [Fusobacteriaceae bacterium]
MEDLRKNVYFMLKNSEKGIYVVAVSKDGQEIKDIEEWLLEDEWLSLSDNEKNILNFINKSSKKEIYGDWDDIWGEGTEGEEFVGETYLKEEGALVDMLLQCENFVDEDYQKVKFSPQGNHLSLVIK